MQSRAQLPAPLHRAESSLFSPKGDDKTRGRMFSQCKRNEIAGSLLWHFCTLLCDGKDITTASPSVGLLPTTTIKASRNFSNPILPLQRAVQPPRNLLVLFSKRNQRQKNDFTLCNLRFFPPLLPLGWRGKPLKILNLQNKTHVSHMEDSGLA